MERWSQAEKRSEHIKHTGKNGFALMPSKQPSNQKKRKEEQAPVLTFVDMSKLKYLSRSVSSGNKLSRKKENQVQIPKNTSTAIVEAMNEEEEDEATPTQIPIVTDKELSETKTPQAMALDIINELVDLVLESAGEAKPGEDKIVTNQLLQERAHNLHKQVFVKVKVASESNALNGVSHAPDGQTAKKSMSNQSMFVKKRKPMTSSGFRSKVTMRKSEMLVKRGPATQDNSSEAKPVITNEATT